MHRSWVTFEITGELQQSHPHNILHLSRALFSILKTHGSHHAEEQTLQQSATKEYLLFSHLFEFADCVVEFFSFFLHLRHLLLDCLHLCNFSLRNGGKIRSFIHSNAQWMSSGQNELYLLL